MALNKTTWEILALDSINMSTESDLASCSTVDLTSTVQLTLSVQNNYSTNASQPAQLRIYTGEYNWSGIDTDPYGLFDNELGSNTSKKITVPISPDPKFIRTTVFNQDSKNISSVSVVVTQGYL